MKEYYYLTDYLKKNIPDYKLILKKHIPKDEDNNVKLILKLFNFFDTLKLIKLFSTIYCKGDKNE